jgi:SAM-dependent methyltransferase
MPNLRTAWSKLRWSLAQRGLGGTLRFALQRTRRRSNQTGKPQTDAAKPKVHPFDQRYGVDTSGLIGGGELRSGHRNDVFNTAYYAIAPSRFQLVMQNWIADQSHAPIEEYNFVDLGCGKGRAVMMASEFCFRQVIGVELHPALAQIAEANIAAWTRARCPVRIVCQDATAFAFPDGPCLLYVFNSFAAPVMKELIERIEIDFAARPRMLDLIYFNPEAGKLLETHRGFELLGTRTVEMSDEDAASDLVASPQDLCSVYRWVGL